MINPIVDGNDIVVRNTKGTRFGGTDDAEDNGIGAWGFDVRGHATWLLVALPIRKPGIPSLKRSPLPTLNGLNAKGTGIVCVRVHSIKTGRVVDCLLADIGPSGNIDRGIDMSNSVVKALGLSLEEGIYDINYRIFGAGAKLSALIEQDRQDANS